MKKGYHRTKSGKIAVDGLTKSFVKAESAFKKLNAEVKNVTKTGINPLSDATGLAGAAVTELGRTISDVNYGFPAVANNISQLGSLFTILIARTGGLTKALKLMWQTVKGPLGVLLAFQTFITVLEAFSKNSAKAEKGIESLSNFPFCPNESHPSLKALTLWIKISLVPDKTVD